MPFGNARAGTIHDPIIEPLWGGLRVLVHVSGGRASVRGHEGEELEVATGLLDAIAACARASELVVDGHLVAGPIRDTVGVRVGMTDTARDAGEMTRHFFLGSLGNKNRDEIARREAAAAAAAAAASPTAFVAVDLLWLDGESLVDVPLLERKRILESVLADSENVRHTVAVRPPIQSWHAQWISLGFDEMAVKGANSRYTPGRPNPEWAIAPIRRR